MNKEFKIPFFLISRHLRRGNKWTLLLTIFLMSIAFINLIFITSLLNGIMVGTDDQVINSLAGNIEILPSENKDFIKDTDELSTKIGSIEGVKAVSPQISVPGKLSCNQYSGYWQVLAIDPGREKEVTNVWQKMIAGEYLKSDDPDGIMIGKQVAGGDDVEMKMTSCKGAKIGDTMTLSLNGNEKDFIIRGIFYTKFIVTDQKAFITRKGLSSLYPGAEKITNNVIIKTASKDNENQIIEKIKEKNINETFYTWKDIGIMNSVRASFFSINVLLTFVGILIAAVTIFIVIYIDINNRRQQIGILRAIGIKSSLIRWAYVLQTLFYSIIGVIVGSAIFFGIFVPYIKAHPFEIPICDATLILDYKDYLFRVAIIILVSLLAGVIPAVLITKIKLLDAIWKKD